MLISAIVTVRNESKNMRDLLDSLVIQEQPFDPGQKKPIKWVILAMRAIAEWSAWKVPMPLITWLWLNPARHIA